MEHENKWNSYEDKIQPDIRALMLTSLWLTKNGPASKVLVRNTLAIFYDSWHPRLSKANVKLILFKILTNLFFNGIPRKKFIPGAHLFRHKLRQIVSLFRLSTPQQDTESLRTLVRLPIEVKFVRVLRKLGGFSPSEIAEIIGVTWGGIEVKHVAGANETHSKVFIYGGDG